MADYEITFTIRCDGEEIGFGGSGPCADVNAAAFAVESIVQNRQWETERGMPEPEEAR